MDIETELPGNFDELDDSEKVEELENLLDKLDDNTDSAALKRRMVEELIRKYES